MDPEFHSGVGTKHHHVTYLSDDATYRSIVQIKIAIQI